jgi:Flp pilus assembly protein TadG
MWRPIRRSSRGAERGAVSAIVAVMLAPVLLGFAALSLDVGNLMWERRQVQNGADATSMALAIACAESVTNCTTANSSVQSGLNALDDANASDVKNQFDPDRFGGFGQCGHLAGTLPPCPSATDTMENANAKTRNLAECPQLPPWLASDPTIPYVETYTLTRSSAGSILPSALSHSILGVPEVGVPACARAAWGNASPNSKNVLSITISECDWAQQVGYPATPTYPPGPVGPKPGYNTSTNPWPSFPTHPGGFEDAVYTKGNPTTCDTSAAGGAAPGGFAALKNSTSCETTLTTGVDGRLWAGGDPGADLPCSPAQLRNLLGTVIYVPIFDCFTKAIVTVTSTTNCNSGLGNNTYYRVSGFAAFYLSGWFLTSDSQPSIRPPNGSPCSGGDRCLYGWFLADIVQDVAISPPPLGSPGYGLKTVLAAG